MPRMCDLQMLLVMERVVVSYSNVAKSEFSVSFFWGISSRPNIFGSLRLFNQIVD